MPFFSYYYSLPFKPKSRKRYRFRIGFTHQQDLLIELGCSCKSDLALVHYACALKWFVNHGSTVCEICGHVAINIRTSDFKKVMVALKDYEALRERTATGDPNPAQVHASAGVDPDAVAAVRRQRLSEISLWFCPHNNNNNNYNNNSAAVSQVVSEQPLNTVTEDIVPADNRATKWAMRHIFVLGHLMCHCFYKQENFMSDYANTIPTWPVIRVTSTSQ
ncbi:hypothetical protein NC652_012473 [Populus alba x Populus x berolinensis]|nr:hypothetical protein NC652_012473 [Populus alba x Populus x berolinensis]